MMVCMAGHVDHGKTSLVKLLTGCETDTLKEEKLRGMTIKLGFAPCIISNDLAFGIVDVPGHEKLIRNMVSGVSGIGAAILVISADDGVMAQTIEHCQILKLMGINHGIVALTKIDLVEPSIVKLRIQEITQFLQTTSLAEAMICPVSCATGEGFDVFFEKLKLLIQKIQIQPKPGIFRMPIEGVFIHQNLGTIISGIPVQGSIALGDSVEVIPGNQIGKIREIQCFSQTTNTGGTGQCLALNIPDFNKHPPKRGHNICTVGFLKVAHCFHAQIKTVPELKRSLNNAEVVKFHTGTAETNAKIYLLDTDKLAPQSTGLATIMLEEPLPLAIGDRFIIRSLSPAMTVGGGTILIIEDTKVKPKRSVITPKLTEFVGKYFLSETALEEPINRIEGFLCWNNSNFVSVDEIAKAVLLNESDILSRLNYLAQSGKVIQLSKQIFIHPETYKNLCATLINELNSKMQKQAACSMDIAELKTKYSWPNELLDKILSDLQNENFLKKIGQKLILSQAINTMPQAHLDLMKKIEQIYEDTGFRSPNPDDLASILGEPPALVAKLFKILVDENKIIKLSNTVALSKRHFKVAQDLVIKLIQENGKLNSADFKYHINSSRKYALAILDYLDSKQITIRINNDRKLATGYQFRLL